MTNEERLKTAPIRTINPHVCPHLILVPQHYREDGSCKCNDPKEKIMRSWGYKWSKEQNQWR